MSSGPYATPIAARRGPPEPPPRPRGRLHAIRNVLRSGTIICLACTASAASCGLVAGGWHGILFATIFFSAMSVLGMLIGLGVAAYLDGSRAVRTGLHGAPLVRSEVLEIGAGQLSEAAPGDGALAHPE